MMVLPKPWSSLLFGVVAMTTTTTTWPPKTLAAGAAAPAPRRALVIGGSGRVGGSTVRWLHELSQAEGRQLSVAVGGRDRRKFEAMRARWRQQSKGDSKALRAVEAAEFVFVDLDDPTSLRDAVRGGFDLVVHTAGPFQQVREPKVLDACLEAACSDGEEVKPAAYVDVCDETELCRVVKTPEYARRAQTSGLRAIVGAGIWPGASALMARNAADRLVAERKRRRSSTDGKIDLDFDFFTAGTGGAGPTIVSATFLLLVTPALTYVDGVAVEKSAWTEPKDVVFGPDVAAGGVVRTRLLDCPEILTVVDALRRDEDGLLRGSSTHFMNNVSAASRFATAPDVWNDLFGAAKRFLPTNLLADRAAMQALAQFSSPVVRAVDALVGSQNVIKVTIADRATGATVEAIHVHDDLEAAVGIGTAAFALDLLDELDHREEGGDAAAEESNNKGSVLWPAELPAHRRDAILRRLLDAPGTRRYEIRDTF